MKLDNSTILGMFIGCSMVLMGMIMSSGWDWGLLYALYVYQPDSFALTVGGSIGGTISCFPLNKVKKMFTVMGMAWKEDPKNTAYVDLINELVDYATEARRNGVLALDAKTEEIADPFIKSGIQMAVDGTGPGQIEEIMELELETMQKRHEENQDIILKWAELAPAYGMIGTLVGLVAMLANLSDPDSLGPSMAIALITTLYGAMVANMFCIPFVGKLKARTKEEVTRKEMIISGILSIQNGDNPRIVKQKLMSYIPNETKPLLATDEE